MNDRSLKFSKKPTVDLTNTRFDGFGDGKVILGPISNRPEFYLSPRKLAKSECRVMIHNFLRANYSLHGFLRSTAWVIIEYCESKGIDYAAKVEVSRRIKVLRIILGAGNGNK